MKGMARYPDKYFDSVITDPPYGLRFMNKKWDYQIPSVEAFREILRIAKPGATLLCFGGTRTWHRIACNIEDAGWEIRDTLMWLYGSGFPKSLNIGKAVDKLQGNEREIVADIKRDKITGQDGLHGGIATERPRIEVMNTKGTSDFEGWGTALKPAYEPIIMAMKPNEGTYAENALKHGLAGLNIDECRIEGKPWKWGTQTDLRGGGLCTKRPSDGHVLAKNIESNPKGRFPANLLLDEETAKMLDKQAPEKGACAPVLRREGSKSKNVYGDYKDHVDDGSTFHNDGLNGASRFFYVAKASKSERNMGFENITSQFKHGDLPRQFEKNDKRGNFHPTVKPLKLMEYLCMLTKTPTGGIVLDPYAGTATTGLACISTGRDFVGFEDDKEFHEIALKRIEAHKAQQGFFGGK